MIRHISLSQVPRKRAAGYVSEAAKDLKEFLTTAAVAGEIAIPKGRSAKSVAQAYRQAAKHLGAEVRISVRDGRVYIIRDRDK